MARRYVRDKAGRFASKGGGGKRAGKLSKSTAGRSAKAAYKSKSGAARKEKSRAAYMRAATEGFKSKPNTRGVKKKRGAKRFDNTTNQMFKQRKLKRDLKRKYPQSKASKRVAAKAKRVGKQSKSTAGRSAKATYKSKTSAVRKARRDTDAPRKAYQAAKANQGRGAKGSYASRQKKIKSTFKTAARAESAVTGKKSAVTRYTKKATAGRKAAGSGIKKGLRSQTALKRKQTFRGKATKGRAARAEYKRASSADRKKHTDMGRKKVIKKQTGKPAFRSNTGFSSPQRTKEPRAGSMTKAQRLKARIENRKSLNQFTRGDQFKGPKKATAKQKAAGKKRSAAVKAKKTAARKATFKGKATQGRAAKATYKSAKGKLREAEKGFGSTSPTQPIGSKGYKKKVAAAKGRLTRVTNKLTAKRAAATPTKKTAATKKPPRTAKGKMAYDGPNKAASEARDRIIAKAKATRAKRK